MKRSTTLFLALLLFPLARCSARNAAAQNAQTAPATGSAAQLTLTTQSARAKELFGQAIVESGNYRLDECLKDLRAAVKEDPDFAAGWALLSYYATDSGESARHCSRPTKPRVALRSRSRCWCSGSAASRAITNWARLPA